MAKRCIYCSKELDEGAAVDVCTECGHGVWGERMFSTIKQNMETAKAKGDLHQGSVGLEGPELEAPSE